MSALGEPFIQGVVKASKSQRAGVSLNSQDSGMNYFVSMINVCLINFCIYGWNWPKGFFHFKLSPTSKFSSDCHYLH